MDEIVQWATADDAFKQRVWAALPQRRLRTFPSHLQKSSDIS
jgi:predicted Fe-S protein YdhL (DUF1289 family)